MTRDTTGDRMPVQLYSARPLQRARQITVDVLAVLAIAASVVLGVAVGALIGSLAALGRVVEDSGDGFRQTMSDAAGALAGLPLVGSGASAPFGSASDAGATLALAGRQLQNLVESTAVVAGILVAGLPILAILLVWLWPRVRWVRRATTAQRLGATPGGVELLALRALTHSRPATLLALTPDPVAAWRSGDPATVRALAALELRDAGARNG